MKILKVVGLFAALFFLGLTSFAQLNDSTLISKGIQVKLKLKPYKKTSDLVLKIKLKNTQENCQQLKFQLYLYVDGKAESLSEQKEVCLRPKKRVKYRFLFETESKGEKTIEFEKLEVNSVENCEPASE